MNNSDSEHRNIANSPFQFLVWITFISIVIDFFVIRFFYNQLLANQLLPQEAKYELMRYIVVVCLFGLVFVITERKRTSFIFLYSFTLFMMAALTRYKGHNSILFAVGYTALIAFISKFFSNLSQFNRILLGAIGLLFITPITRGYDLRLQLSLIALAIFVIVNKVIVLVTNRMVDKEKSSLQQAYNICAPHLVIFFMALVWI